MSRVGAAAGGVEVTHLRVLVALADEGTFTDAAIAVGMSQPAVSRALARFEAILGVQLVRRTTRTLSLTDAGQAAYDAAVSVLHGLDALVDAASGRIRPLRLGYSWAAFGPYTNDILRAWRDDHAEVPLEAHRVDERDAGLRRGAVDIAIRRGPVDEAGVRVEPLFDEGRMAAVPTVSAFAGRGRLTLADLVDEVIALVPAIGTTTLDLWPADARPARFVEVTNTDEWLMAISSGEAIGVTPESTSTQHPHPGVRYVPMPDVPRTTVSLVWATQRPHPAIAEFVELARACVQDPG
jgi:DNA-binding transcriptional LysR family regulator